MIVPNKIVSLEESILGKSCYILRELSTKPSSLVSLFETVKEYFTDINEFVLALDVLFSLDKITLTTTNEVYKNA